MKTIVFSFDDGREDTYGNAVSILKKYGYRATVNIATDYLLNPSQYTGGSFKNHKPMTVAQVIELYKDGFEIAGHGNKHKNETADILEGIELLGKWGIDVHDIGFASPYSFLTRSNLSSIQCEKDVSYIRSGIQVRRNGILYSALYYLQEKCSSKLLFYLLNKAAIITGPADDHFYIGVTITNKTTAEQLTYLIGKMPENSGIVLIFHSVEQYKGNPDRWSWKMNNLEKLCSFLRDKEKFEVLTMHDYVKKMQRCKNV